MTSPTHALLDIAWQRLHNGYGQSEIPDIINFADIDSVWGQFRQAVVNSIRGGEVGPEFVEVVDLPKNPIAVRPLARLSVHDRLVYDTLVFSIARIVDHQLRDSVFSARWGKDGSEFWSPVHSWVEMQRHAREVINTLPFQLARTDVVSFYEHIDADILADDIESIGAGKEIVNPLTTYLRRFQSSGSAWGIPQGPDASGILANLYLLPVDEFMQRSDFHYLRYSDDMMIFERDWESLRGALLEINSILRSRRLTMSATKTRIYDFTESIGQVEDLQKDAINYGVRVQAYGIEDHLFKVFESATETHPQNYRDIKFSLFRMGELEDDRAVPWVMQNLRASHHLASQMLAYLANFPMYTAEVALAYASTLDAVAGMKYDHLEQCILRAATRQGIHHPRIKEIAWAILRDANKSPLPREFAARYLGRCSTIADGQLLRREYESERDNHIRRALLVAMYESHSLPKSLARGLASSSQELSRVCSYLLSDPCIPLPR